MIKTPMQRRAVEGEKTDEQIEKCAKNLRKKKKCKKKLTKEEKWWKISPKTKNARKNEEVDEKIDQKAKMLEKMIMKWKIAPKRWKIRTSWSKNRFCMKKCEK